VLHHDWWSNLFMRENVVLIVTAIVLFFLSAVKILTGLRIGSDAMLTEGAENLTDFLKIGIIYAGIRLNKTRLASWVIIGMMLLTGGGMLWSSIASLVSNARTAVTPGIVAYVVVVLSLVLNYVLMVYKGLVGRISGNLSLLSDAKDSEINIVISLGVLAGFLLAVLNLPVVDTIVGGLIALFCIKEAVALAIEVFNFDKGTSTFMVVSIPLCAKLPMGKCSMGLEHTSNRVCLDQNAYRNTVMSVPSIKC
jgi:divalent metal cation (Fe/Co/Zn/Cd) transporter